MVIFKIQTYLDAVSGQKLQKNVVFMRSRSYFSFYKDMVYRTRKIYKDNSIANSILRKIVSIHFCPKKHSFCINKAESGKRI